MALIKCNNCGGIVSDKAKACPHCGSPIIFEQGGNSQPAFNKNQNTEPVYYDWEDKEKSNSTLKWLLIALAGLIVLGGAAFYAWHSGMFENDVVPPEEESTVVVEAVEETAMAGQTPMEATDSAAAPVGDDEILSDAAPVQDGKYLAEWTHRGTFYCCDFVIKDLAIKKATIDIDSQVGVPLRAKLAHEEFFKAILPDRSEEDFYIQFSLLDWHGYMTVDGFTEDISVELHRQW